MNVVHLKEDYSAAAQGQASWTTTAPPDDVLAVLPRGGNEGSSRARPRGPRTLAARWLDSFRRAHPGAHRTRPVATPTGEPGWSRFVGVDYHVAPGQRPGSMDSWASIGRGWAHYDYRAATAATARCLLVRELQGRHLQMIAIGGSIGG